MLNFILDTFKNNEDIEAVVLDKTKILKSDFCPISDKIIKKREGYFINLDAVKEFHFVGAKSGEKITSYGDLGF